MGYNVQTPRPLKMKFIIFAIMIGMASGLKCFIGSTVAGATTKPTSQTCPTGLDRCLTVKSSVGSVYSCNAQAACGATGASCCSTDDCNNPNGGGGKSGGSASYAAFSVVATAIAAYFM